MPFDLNSRLLTQNIWMGPYDSRVNADEVPTTADKELHSQTRDCPDSGASAPPPSLTSLTLPLWPSCSCESLLHCHPTPKGSWREAKVPGSMPLDFRSHLPEEAGIGGLLRGFG